MIIEKIAIMISTSFGISILTKCIKQDQTTKIENKVKKLAGIPKGMKR